MRQCVRCSKEAKAVLSIYDLGYYAQIAVVTLCCSCLPKVLKQLNRMQEHGNIPATTKWYVHKIEPSA